MSTVEECISYTEGRLDALSTKEDLANIRADLLGEISKIEPRIIKWMVGMVISSVAIATTLAIFIQGQLS